MMPSLAFGHPFGGLRAGFLPPFDRLRAGGRKDMPRATALSAHGHPPPNPPTRRGGRALSSAHGRGSTMAPSRRSGRGWGRVARGLDAGQPLPAQDPAWSRPQTAGGARGCRAPPRPWTAGGHGRGPSTPSLRSVARDDRMLFGRPSTPKGTAVDSRFGMGPSDVAERNGTRYSSRAETGEESPQVPQAPRTPASGESPVSR